MSVFSAAAPSTATSRPPEVEEPLNRWIVHPLSRGLVQLLIPTGISPNAVSVLGVVMMATAAACYANLPWPWSALVGVTFQAAWHVFDGADGELARRTGRASPDGEIVDGICDHLSHLILYVVMGAILAERIGAWSWPIAAVAGASRAFHANAYETVRRNYRRWVYDVRWIRQNVGQAAPPTTSGTWRNLAIPLARLYLKTSQVMSADDSAVEAVMLRLLATDKAPAARALYRASQEPMVNRASWLSTNYETLAAALSILAGSPLWFLLNEITLLNIVMVLTIRAQGRSYKALVEQLEALERG